MVTASLPSRIKSYYQIFKTKQSQKIGNEQKSTLIMKLAEIGYILNNLKINWLNKVVKTIRQKKDFENL